jgi:hypothetical protein
MGGMREQHQACLGMVCGRLWCDLREGCCPSRRAHAACMGGYVTDKLCTTVRASTREASRQAWRPPTMLGPREVTTGRVGYEGYRP